MNQENDTADMSAPEGDNEPFHGGESANMIFLSEEAYPNAKDGEKVSTQVEGTLVIHDGKKYLSVETADGKPVASFNEEDDQPESSDEEIESQLSDYSDKNTGNKSYF